MLFYWVSRSLSVKIRKFEEAKRRNAFTAEKSLSSEYYTSRVEGLTKTWRTLRHVQSVFTSHLSRAVLKPLLTELLHFYIDASVFTTDDIQRNIESFLSFGGSSYCHEEGNTGDEDDGHVSDSPPSSAVGLLLLQLVRQLLLLPECQHLPWVRSCDFTPDTRSYLSSCRSYSTHAQLLRRVKINRVPSGRATSEAEGLVLKWNVASHVSLPLRQERRGRLRDPFLIGKAASHSTLLKRVRETAQTHFQRTLAPIDVLPSEVLCLLLGYVPPCQSHTLTLVCKRWRWLVLQECAVLRNSLRASSRLTKTFIQFFEGTWGEAYLHLPSLTNVHRLLAALSPERLRVLQDYWARTCESAAMRGAVSQHMNVEELAQLDSASLRRGSRSPAHMPVPPRPFVCYVLQECRQTQPAVYEALCYVLKALSVELRWCRTLVSIEAARGCHGLAEEALRQTCLLWTILVPDQRPGVLVALWLRWTSIEYLTHDL
ncbi:hypothetical protein AGDE_15737 [Angomonas deanei]|nr:hypothetical protein AGDE_15737 [Angomonas deanei]|eukprot:EPY18555.1 hypothetical protein AGDE_15737 [Angomonas deanei]